MMRPDERSAERRGGLGAALFGAALLLLAGAAGAADATHGSRDTPGLFGMLTRFLGCLGSTDTALIEVFDAADLAMFDDVAEPPQ